MGVLKLPLNYHNIVWIISYANLLVGTKLLKEEFNFCLKEVVIEDYLFQIYNILQGVSGNKWLI